MNIKNNHIHPVRKLIDGLYTRKDLAEMNSAFGADERDETLGELDTLWEQAQHEAADTDDKQHVLYKQEAKRLLHSLHKTPEKPVRRLNTNWWRYAAAIVVLAMGATFGLYKLTDNPTTEEIVYSTIEVMNGKRKRVTLPDGSVALLNAGTKIQVPDKFAAGERRIYLDGEGYFDVTKNGEKPFIIECTDFTVQVLGTTFNVKAYNEDDYYNVCVEGGKVQVDMTDAMVRLLPEEQIVMDKTSKEFKREKELSARVLSWRQGGLYFNKTPLRSVANEIYRIYDRKVLLAKDVDPTIGIYGEHDNKSLESLLESICYATGFEYKEEDGHILIYKP